MTAIPLTRSAPTVIQQRQVRLNDQIVSYELRQAAGRRLSIRIDERGVRVGAPKSSSMQTIEAFIRAHGDWLLRKVAERTAIVEQRRIDIADGAVLPVLGESVVVRVISGPNRAYWHQRELILAARQGANLTLLLRKALKERALAYFQERLQYYAVLIGKQPPALALSSARTRWGSCSNNSGIRINWRLIHLAPQFADYVVAHELAHTVEMNHSERFWAVVNSLYADWRSVRTQLKVSAAAIPIF